MIAIALATHNGARWLPAQLASLAEQTISAAVVAGDDGSDDATMDLLRSWDRRPRVLPSVESRLGAMANFERVLAVCDADWIACCDQDDIWDPDHLACLHAAGCETARALPIEVPLLVVGDMRVIDGAGNTVHPSFRRFQSFDPYCGSQLGSLAVMNVFPGCAMLANRALLRAALPLPRDAVMHDWWMALCAVSLGRIVIVDRTIGSYRVHGNNALGAESFDWRRRWHRLFAGDGRVRAELARASAQCSALLARHRERLAPDARRILETAVAMPRMHWLERRAAMLRHGIKKHPWLRQVNMMLRA